MVEDSIVKIIFIFRHVHLSSQIILSRILFHEEIYSSGY